MQCLQISLEQIDAAEDRFTRATPCEQRRKYYAALMTKGSWEWESYIPPLVIFDGERYHLARGYLRYYSARDAGLQTIWCRVVTGTEADAYRHTIEAPLGDDELGLPRTVADNKRLVEVALRQPEYAERSNQSLSKLLPMSDHSINVIRKRLERAGEIVAYERRTSKPGYTLPSSSNKKTANRAGGRGAAGSRVKATGVNSVAEERGSSGATAPEWLPPRMPKMNQPLAGGEDIERLGRRVQELEQENMRLERLLAAYMFEVDRLQEQLTARCHQPGEVQTESLTG